ncbi:MAG: hypothetical protein AAF226_06975 [Verrucomicrobiota bacterium]
MKKFLIHSFFVLAISLSASAAELVKLTSADGTKSLQAKIENYDPASGAALINVNGRNMKVPVSAFQKEDKTVFENWYQASQVGRKLAITVEEFETDGSEKKTSNAKVTTYSSGYKVKVRNNATNEFDNVTLRYRIFHYADKERKDGGKEETFTEGDLSLAAISARQVVDLATEQVELTRIRPLPASQCVGGG